ICFFFQAEDGIRDKLVTGVQSVLFRSSVGAALKAIAQLREFAQEVRLTDDIRRGLTRRRGGAQLGRILLLAAAFAGETRLFRCEIGRASCRERVQCVVGGGSGWREKEY